MSKKYFSFFLIIVFLFLFSSFCLAKEIERELEVDYPTLPTGETITPTTPITKYVKYMFDFGMLIGFFAAVVSLIIGGILYIGAAASPGLKNKARSLIFGAISGTILLAVSYLIITTINPHLKILREPELVPVPTPGPPPPLAGVYLYLQEECPSSPDPSFLSATYRSSLSKFVGRLRNNIKSVKIVHSPPRGIFEGIYYIAILYDEWYYRGKCQYIDPNDDCTNVEPFASSVSIHRYDSEPENNPDNIGVTFYRKPFYNEEGGWYKVENFEELDSDNDIKGIYKGYLENLKFVDEKGDCNVPIEEQDCMKWDLKGKCAERGCPNLAKGNISSIKIDGNYSVLLIYYPPEGGTEEFSSCQAFPTEKDINKKGPEQIKWDYIRRQTVLLKGKYPNWVLIFPVKNK